MIALIKAFWRPALALAVVGGIWWHGYATGRDRCTAAHDLATARAMAGQVKALADLAAAEQRNRLLSLELEDAARAEPPSSPACLPVSRVLRLNQR